MIHGCYAQPSLHALTHLIFLLSSNVLYSACLPIQFKREFPNVLKRFHLCLCFLFVHHASFQGLYLSQVIANLLQSCKLQCRASYNHNAKWNLKCKLQTRNIECESPKA